MEDLKRQLRFMTMFIKMGPPLEALEPMLHNKRRYRNEKPVHHS